MRRLVCATLIASCFAAAIAHQADAADAPVWRPSPTVHQLPFPRSQRAASVWDERACWSDCGSHCAWGMAGCLAQDAQGRCLTLADRCDRYCQAQCREQGGPFLNLAN